jgi:ferredoxin
MKVTVDYELCTSIGTCTRICPEVFRIGSDGLLYVLQDEPPESLRAQVEEAVEMCPMAAITIAG